MSENGEETTLCKNCQRQISTSNFVLHEMHCKRNISLCQHCDEPIPKAEMEIHYEENHAKIPCPKCRKEVEKSHLEIHEEEECPKRQVKCHYCEMDVAHSELEAHQGYCGSRTEPCVMCGQYIMVKDMARHEESKCNYPEQKLTNGNKGPRNVTNNTDTGHDREVNMGDDYLFGSGDLNSFQFNEISRILNMDHLGGVQNPNGIDRSVPTTRTSSMANKNVKKETNITRANKKADLSKHGDDALIPCEFCGGMFPIEDLVMHQSSCTEDQLSSLMAPPQTNNYMFEDDDNRLTERLSPTARTIPHVIDNLHNYDDDYELDNRPDDAMMGLDQDLMLPCEFCDELFPQDMLVLHQAVCEADTLKTPRVMSPAISASRRPTNVQRSKGQHQPPNINTILYGKDNPPLTPSGPHSQELDQTLRKYGTSPFDPYIPKSPRRAFETDSRGAPLSQSKTQSSSKARVDSARRTQQTLNRLLSEDRDPHSPPPGFSSSRKNSKENVNMNRHTRQTTTPAVSLRKKTTIGQTKKTITANSRESSRQVDDLHDPLLAIGNIRQSNSRTQRTTDIDSASRYTPTATGSSGARQRDQIGMSSGARQRDRAGRQVFDYPGESRTGRNSRGSTRRRDD